ncbi:MAG: S8 family serine peptidase [Bacteroidetes bacterium]|nr:S8 family serine peptidase [Bacteroidota bacterium]
MLKSFWPLLFLVLTISQSFSQALEKNYREGEMMVQLKPGQSPDDFISQYPGLIILETIAENWNIYLVGYNHLKRSESSIFNDFGRSSVVAAFQRNHKVELRAAMPDDAQFGDMWGLHNTGQGGGKAGADISAPDAWDITTGGLTANGDTIVVAVIDNGFQLNHPDLNFWKNYQEIPGNGIDDDGNGYVDDLNGWNAVDQNGTINSAQHGTHVSGTVGARGNNEIGVTGVNWNVKVMAIRGSSGNEATVVRAYNYAYTQRKLYDQTNGQKGAFVVSTNASFGVDNGNPANFPLWCAIYDSLGTLGILNAGATANSNYNIDITGDMPTACPSDWLITVTNTTRNDLKNSGAAYGLTTIDLGAPGTQVLSTVTNSNYSSLTGTSMATPHVAGTIALMWAAACPEMLLKYKAEPAATASIMKGILLNNTDPISALQDITVTGGRLNAHKALLGVIEYCEYLAAPLVEGDTVCLGVPFYLVGDPNGPNRDVYWYHNPTAGHIFIGDTLHLPGIFQDEVYYAANLDLITNILSPQIAVPVNVDLPIQAISADTSIMKFNGAAQLWVNGSGNNFSWQPVDGLNDPNISNPIASPSVTTTYFVTANGQFNCTATDSVTVNVVDNTIVSAYPPFDNLKVYPVPSRGSVIFDFNKSIKESHKITIRIVDMLGKTVKQDKITGNMYVLERENIAPGFYWYIIENPVGPESPSGKIIFID